MELKPCLKSSARPINPIISESKGTESNSLDKFLTSKLDTKCKFIITPNMTERVMAKPPNLEFPEDTPCLLLGSLPNFNSDKPKSIARAINPFMPVIIIIKKEISSSS